LSRTTKCISWFRIKEEFFQTPNSNYIAVGLILRSRKASVLATAHPISPESIDDPDDAGQKAERFARFELIT
jgi:hypothetical protein